MTTSPSLPDPTAAAVKLLAKTAISTPPVNLEQIISNWPNLFVVEEELDGAGYLLPIGELGAEILINKADIEERRRFTLAHELGHWVLGLTLKRKIGHFSQPKNVHRIEIERWCDAFATNLLMPQSMVVASVPGSDPLLAINLIASAAARFKVSEEAFFIRLWETLKFQVALVSQESSSGVPEFRLKRSFASDRERLAIEKLLEKGDFVKQLQNAQLPILSFVSEQGKVRCAVRRIRSDMLFLLFKWPDLAK
jgi:Zn-dependent peptidase ImmA (M78 family)